MLSNVLVEEVYERARRRAEERRREDRWSDRIYSFMEGVRTPGTKFGYIYTLISKVNSTLPT
jgi:hypothetical protein